MKKSLSLVTFLLVIGLSIALAGCGESSTSSPGPTPTLNPTPITEDEMNTLLDKTQQAFLKEANPTECFTEPDVDCGSSLGRLSPQAIIDYFGTDGVAFKSFIIKDRAITGPNTLQFQLEYIWAGTDATVPQGPCDIQVEKTSMGWRISSFGGVLVYFPKAVVQSHIFKR